MWVVNSLRSVELSVSSVGVPAMMDDELLGGEQAELIADMTARSSGFPLFKSTRRVMSLYAFVDEGSGGGIVV